MVGKLAILKFSEGSFDRGFSVTLQIGDEHSRPTTEVSGQLPPNPEIPRDYSRWQAIYQNLIAHKVMVGRPVCLPKPGESIATREECQQAAQQLSDLLNTWLRADSFHLIREKWLATLQRTDDLRVLLQTEDVTLQKLPWHLWNLFTYFPNAEIALCAPHYEKVTPLLSDTGSPKILAILGNCEGIDVAGDRAVLQAIGKHTVEFLPEPALKDLTDELWQQSWRILFFAGHSASQAGGTTGRILVNASESLSMQQLKCALQHSIQRGLRLAIFNSCDGLGLARELADLHIPQLIVMREPVPDYVAQEFLKYFLQFFASGKSLYQAVRQARERLQGLETEFPCATWLPVIWQNPAEVPPTWRDLMAKSEVGTSAAPANWRDIVRAIGISTAITVSLLVGRHVGLLQSLELQAFDRLLQLRLRELPDPRLLIVTIDDADIQHDRRTQKRGPGSISDAALNQLLQKLAQHQPRLIGLDIFRDFPVERQPELAKQLQQMPNVIAICRGSDTASQIEGNPPPPGLPPQRLGFADFVVDPDGIIRRHLLYMDLEPASPCTTNYAFSTRLAALYLSSQGLAWKFTQANDLQLGTVVFKSLHAYSGGYAAIDDWGRQIFLNYRQPTRSFEQVTLKQILNNQVSPNFIKNRIVLIGYTAKVVNDFSPTPYGLLPGVVIHAHMTSQLLSAVQDGRPLLWHWSEPVEMIWIWGWAIAGGLAVQRLPKSTLERLVFRTMLVMIVLGGSISIICYSLFTQGGWVPLVPAVFGMCVTATGVSLTRINFMQMNLSLNLPFATRG